jgi:hypothetical protein
VADFNHVSAGNDANLNIDIYLGYFIFPAYVNSFEEHADSARIVLTSSVLWHWVSNWTGNSLQCSAISSYSGRNSGLLSAKPFANLAKAKHLENIQIIVLQMELEKNLYAFNSFGDLLLIN